MFSFPFRDYPTRPYCKQDHVTEPVQLEQKDPPRLVNGHVKGADDAAARKIQMNLVFQGDTSPFGFVSLPLSFSQQVFSTNVHVNEEQVLLKALAKVPLSTVRAVIKEDFEGEHQHETVNCP